MKPTKDHHQEAEQLILSLTPKRTAHIQEKYVGAGVSPYRFLNLSMPQVREFAKTRFSFHQDRSVWKSWNHIWNSTEIYDLLTAAIIWASGQSLEDQWKNRKILLGWSTKANNWALADGLCSIYAELFEAHPKEMLVTLEKWSRSKNPWQQRMSIVSLFYYARLRERHASYALAEKLILRQLDHEHYYVQKAVGWALRETWNVYPERTFKLLRKIAARIPPAGWTAATEKLTQKHKAELAKLRSAKRTSRS
jgi:3-methyladenine DNA glycosylase AlkD